MSVDQTYKAFPLIYKSRGLVARYISDETPAGSYLDFLNCLERAENSVSSRYGYEIVNRDPAGTIGGQNYYFANPIIHLDHLSYTGQAFRYAADTLGNLYRRSSNIQGPYALLMTGLSGGYFHSVTQTCFETNQPYLMMFDANGSIKDTGTLAFPQLVGIDPPTTTANTQPYSPLLTLIDNFAPTNTYTFEGWSTNPTFSEVTQLMASYSQQITDFPEFIGITNSSGGGGGTYPATTGEFGTPIIASLFGTGSDSVTSPPFGGFAATAISLDSTVTVAVSLAGVVIFQYDNFSVGNPWVSGTGTINYQYSLDGGVSWNTFYSISQSVPNADPNAGTPTPSYSTISFTVSGFTNLSLLMLQITISTTGTLVNPTEEEQESIGWIASATATVDVAGATDPFAGVVDGMLSVLNTSAPFFPAGVQITTVQSATPNPSGGYNQLLVTTQSPHGYGDGSLISIYASSSDLVDGFYSVASVVSSTTFLINYFSSVYLSATGGITYGGLTYPATCVVANHQSTPYPSQFSGWGFYQQVPTSRQDFAVG